MNNAAACGHPIDLTRLDRLMRAQTVAVDKLTFQQISHCRQSDMRMRRNIDSSARSKGHGSHVIEKDEWPHKAADARWQETPYLQTSNISRSCIDDRRNTRIG